MKIPRRSFFFSIFFLVQILVLSYKMESFHGLNRHMKLGMKDDQNGRKRLIIGDIEIPIARKKKNKYEQFSKFKGERLTKLEEERIFEARQQLGKKKPQQPIRGVTTIPHTAKVLSLQHKITELTLQPPRTTMKHSPTKLLPLIDDLKNIDPSDPFTFGFQPIGRIVSSHGVHGEVKMSLLDTTTTFRLHPNQQIYIKSPHRKTPRPIRLLSHRKQKDSLYLLTLEDISNRNKADFLQKYTVYLLKSEMEQLKENEYYYQDLLNLNCFICDENSTLLSTKPFGQIHQVITPEDFFMEDSSSSSSDSNDNSARNMKRKLMQSFLEIELLPEKAGDLKNYRSQPFKELTLIPLVDAVVPKIDVANKMVFIKLTPEFLEYAYVEEKEKPVVKGLLPLQSQFEEKEGKEKENEENERKGELELAACIKLENVLDFSQAVESNSLQLAKSLSFAADNNDLSLQQPEKSRKKVLFSRKNR
jgi:16S rRNA processing protein RimM